MFAIVQRKFAAGLRGVLRSRLARRFVRQQEGVAAVEFALVAAPFLALTFAILESAMVFFASQTLEAAATDSARLIMTGEAQTSSFSKEDFKTQVCARISGLFDCSKGVYVDVKSYSEFAKINTASPVTDGKLDTGEMEYEPGEPGEIVVVSLYYEWPIYVSLFSSGLSNLSGGSRLLAATSVFRVEPYK